MISANAEIGDESSKHEAHMESNEYGTAASEQS